MLLLIKFWREGLIGLLIIALISVIFFYKGVVNHQKKEIEQLNIKNVELTSVITDLDNKSKLQREQIENAIKKQKEVTKKYEVQISNLKKQRVPTECKDAIQFAIDRKGELLWTK